MVSELVLEEVDKQNHNRLLRFKRAWKAYEGNLEPALKPIASDPNASDNVRINLAALVCDTSTSALWPQDLYISAQNDDTQQWLSLFFDVNDLRLTLHNLGITGAVCGHCFLKLDQPIETDIPRLTVLDPSNVTMLAEQDDYTDIFLFKIQWSGVDYRSGRAYIRRQIHERNETKTAWQITDEIQYGDGKAYSMLGIQVWKPKWELINETIHPYPWAQIHHCQNLPLPNVLWGAPDLDDDIIELNAAINANRSYVQRLIRMYANPQAVAKGFTAERLLVGADHTIHIPADGELFYLEMRNQLQGITEHYLRLLEAFHSVTRVPQIATGRTEDLGALSGIALKVLYGPLVQKTETKRQLYGKLLQNIIAHAGEMVGLVIEPTITWPDIVPTDDMTMLQIATAKKELGVSTETLLTEIGYDATIEKDRRMSERVEEATVGETLLTAFERGQNLG